MNVKQAKAIRRLIDFDPNSSVEYKPMKAINRNGQLVTIKETLVCTGVKADYKLLKKYFKGKITNLPARLRKLI